MRDSNTHVKLLDMLVLKIPYQKNLHYYFPWQEELRKADAGPVIAIEYFSDSPLTSLEIIPGKIAADTGLIILGVTEYRTAKP